MLLLGLLFFIENNARIRICDCCFLFFIVNLFTRYHFDDSVSGFY